MRIYYCYYNNNHIGAYTADIEDMIHHDSGRDRGGERPDKCGIYTIDIFFTLSNNAPY